MNAGGLTPIKDGNAANWNILIRTQVKLEEWTRTLRWHINGLDCASGIFSLFPDSSLKKGRFQPKTAPDAVLDRLCLCQSKRAMVAVASKQTLPLIEKADVRRQQRMLVFVSAVTSFLGYDASFIHKICVAYG